MPLSKKAKLTKRNVDSFGAEAARYMVVDSEIPGFRLRVTPKGKKSFYFRYRVGGGRGATIREPKIGDFGQVTPDQARQIAAEWSAEVRQGGDPGGTRQKHRGAPRMNDLFDRYLDDHARLHKKPSSVEQDEMLLRKYLRPSLGSKRVSEVVRADIINWHRSLAQIPYRANRGIALLSKAFNLAEAWGWRTDGSNPCRHVKKYKEQARRRYLSQQELSRLGEALSRAEKGELEKSFSQYVVAVIRLLVLTGARRGEILSLRWDYVNFERACIELPDSKTGEKDIHLSPAALQILSTLPRKEENPYVIVGGKAGKHLVNLKDPWGIIRKAAGLDDVRLHDLRHSFASVGARAGMSLPVIGALLGHRETATTARYAHLSDDPLRAAADTIGEEIADAMRVKRDG
ncbi:tyrosine-type recombinase/integrase [Rhodobacteraceae bacterium R_SAG10]|jgi:integrase|nr:tyrosine-type recombinase/integrase [Rhodobacteraceae bacterium R_SAG10]